MAQMDGAVSYCFWDMLKKKKINKNTGLQGSTLSGPRMTTGFGPFELPTRVYNECSVSESKLELVSVVYHC